MPFRRGSLVAVALVLAALLLAVLVRPAAAPPALPQPAASAGLPRLVELGSESCQACQAMQPVLAQLRREYDGRLAVEFIDVWKQPDRAEPYTLRMIPTQVFLAPDGRELARHEGFLGAADIVGRFAEHGIVLGSAPQATADAPVPLGARLASAIEGARGPALLAALLWGVLSIVLSPCHLAAIPLVVGFLGGYREGGGRSALRVSSAFAAGVVAALAVAGGAALALGTMAGDLGPWPSYLLALLVAAIGLNLLGALPVDWTAPRLERFARGGVFAPLLLGLVFGLALGPCAFAFVAPLLATAFSVARTQAVFAAALLAAFALGHGLAIVAGAASLDRVQRAVAWSGSSVAAGLRRAFGAALVLAAIWWTWSAA